MSGGATDGDRCALDGGPQTSTKFRLRMCYSACLKVAVLATGLRHNRSGKSRSLVWFTSWDFMANRRDGRPRAFGELRPSQIITTFGPGSVVDLRNASVIMAGTDYWTTE